MQGRLAVRFRWCRRGPVVSSRCSSTTGYVRWCRRCAPQPPATSGGVVAVLLNHRLHALTPPASGVWRSGSGGVVAMLLNHRLRGFDASGVARRAESPTPEACQHVAGGRARNERYHRRAIGVLDRIPAGCQQALCEPSTYLSLRRRCQAIATPVSIPCGIPARESARRRAHWGSSCSWHPTGASSRRGRRRCRGGRLR